MTANITALACTAGISMVLPLIVFGILWLRNRGERKGMTILFLSGAAIYAATQWGIKEHGLTLLFNHTGLADFMDAHYIPYLFLVALVGALLAMFPEYLVIRFAMKKQITFKEAVTLGLGYGMTEAVLLVGYRSIGTIIELVREPETDLKVTTTELFLSGYERLLIMLIEIALLMLMIYLIEQNMTVRGCVLEVAGQTMTAFLPGFFIAFSMKNYFEVYDRSVGLLLVYIMLTVSAVCGIIVINSLKYGYNTRA
ncbi:MAG: YhfC family intramembrane metalloprotease [Lachnospiraceae bacterium]|nr:YhfC family intramembrane metalloprotease [Lachnospiraceae bacterium]